MLIEKSISTNIKTCKDFDYDLTIEHTLRWNVLSRRATLQHLLWKTFEMKCILSSERVGEKKRPGKETNFQYFRHNKLF